MVKLFLVLILTGCGQEFHYDVPDNNSIVTVSCEVPSTHVSGKPIVDPVDIILYRSTNLINWEVIGNSCHYEEDISILENGTYYYEAEAKVNNIKSERSNRAELVVWK